MTDETTASAAKVSPISTTNTIEAKPGHYYLIHRIIALIEKDFDAVKAWVEAEEAKVHA